MPVTFESETDTAEFRRSRWKEWSGRFRDDVRSFFCGEQRVVTRFSDGILGSPEMMLTSSVRWNRASTS